MEKMCLSVEISLKQPLMQMSNVHITPVVLITRLHQEGHIAEVKGPRVLAHSRTLVSQLVDIV